jgi:acyl-CoA synthetase (AMP-forming)/AMP-acid ligase II
LAASNIAGKIGSGSDAMNLISILSRAVDRHGERSAVACCGVDFSYAEFGWRVAGLAAALQKLGVGPGAPLAMLHRNCHRYLEAYFAAAALEAMFVPLNYRLGDAELAAILTDSEAGCLIAEARFLGRAQGALAELPPAARPRLIRAGGAKSDYESLIAAAEKAALPEPATAAERAAQLYYTSGSTGAPKGVILTHGNVASHSRAAIEELALSGRDTWLHAAPLFHLADAWATWAITWVGGRHVMLPDFEPELVFRAIAAEKVTVTNLVPTMLVGLVHHPDANAAALRSMRLILSGGAPMSLELLREVEALFPCEYVQTYGLTETSPYLTLSLLSDELRRLPPDDQRRYRAMTGRAMRDVELRVVDAEGEPVPMDGETVGEIVARGPTVSPGYFKRPEETEAAFRGGWLHTGDLATIDAEGYVLIVDRLKDVINSGGEKIHSIEVENALLSSAAVKEAAAIAVPDAKWGEAVLAVVVPKAERSCGEEEIIAHCRERLASFKVPRRVLFLDALPRTGSGKIDKRALREPYWGEGK